MLRVAEQEGQASEVVEEPADVESVLLLLVERLRPLGIRAREHPVAPPLGDDRRLEVPVSESFTVAEPLRELERRLDVGTSRLPVALAPVAAGPPAEDPAAKPVVDRVGVAHQLERLGEERDRRRHRRQPVAALPDVEEDVGAIDVRERVVVDEIACLRRAWTAPPRSARARSAPSRRRAAPAARGPARGPDRRPRVDRDIAIALSNSRAATAASARETMPAVRSCSGEETPVSRNRRETSSRSASQSRAASFGRTRPRSIWLTYSFEKRPSPSLACVKPRAMRSCRMRSPSADGADALAGRVRASAEIPQR